MHHDLAGRRLQILRDGREWIHEYDLNGNMTASRVPRPDATQGAGGYAISQKFDELDRITLRWADWRDLTLLEQVRYENRERTTFFHYDGHGTWGARNAIGQLTYVDMPIGSSRYR